MLFIFKRLSPPPSAIFVHDFWFNLELRLDLFTSSKCYPNLHIHIIPTVINTIMLNITTIRKTYLSAF